MLQVLNKSVRRLCSGLRWRIRHRSKPKIVVKRLGSKSQTETRTDHYRTNGSFSALVHPNGHGKSDKEKPIKVATFNAALFSMAPVVPTSPRSRHEDEKNSKVLRTRSVVDRPKGILKQSPLHPNSISTPNGNDYQNLSKQQKFVKSNLRVSINLPDNEISLLRNKRRMVGFVEDGQEEGDDDNSLRALRGKAPMRSHSASYVRGAGGGAERDRERERLRSSRTVVEVLKELDADIVALQDVKAEEEKEMKPLSDLADALGMTYVFAESWAPEYGNAILSRWPIKSWKVHKIFDDTDFRNVLKATIDVPHMGEVNFYCTHLDHLDENWRMKQINAIIQSNDGCHILAGGLNSLDESDYSAQRWTDIVKYYEEIGKPTPKVEVMKFLKSRRYTDAKDFAGECESVVMIAKGQNVQGTCKYGTRVDYILASPNSPYKFVPGSYSVFSSKGTSDHHIVKVDISKVESNSQVHDNHLPGKRCQPNSRVVKITNSDSTSRGIWKTFPQ